MENGLWKLLLNLDRDPTVGAKVMTLSYRYTRLERPDLRLTEYQFHIHFMQKGLWKLL
jgi:hypothetical protein